MYKPKIQTKVVTQITTKRQNAKLYHDKGAKELPKLIVGQPVMVKVHPQQAKSEWKTGIVKDQSTSPRRYTVEVNGRNYKRNRVHLKDTLISKRQSDKTTVISTQEKEVAPEEEVEKQKAVTLNPNTAVKSNKDSENTANLNNADSAMICIRAGRLVKPPTKLNL